MKNFNDLLTEEVKEELFFKTNNAIVHCLDKEWSEESGITINEAKLTNNRISIILYDFYLNKPHFIVEINVKTPSDTYIYSALFDLGLNLIDDMLR